MESNNKRKKLYIAGKISGDDSYKEKFHSAENILYLAGYDPVNPVKYNFENETWNSAMKQVLQMMLQCDGVALLFDWTESRGAKIEERLAREVGIPVKPIKKWILEDTK